MMNRFEISEAKRNSSKKKSQEKSKVFFEKWLNKEYGKVVNEDTFVMCEVSL